MGSGTGKRGPGDGSGRDNLIRATVHIVATKGMRGLTFRAVADEADVNNSLIAHHFGNRDNLIEAALDWVISTSIDDSHLDQFAKDKEGYVADLMKLLGTEQEQENEIFQYEMLLESRRRPELRPKILELYSRFSVAIANSLKSVAGDRFNEARASYAFAALDGLVLQSIAGVDNAIIESAVRQLWDDVVESR